jgi:signal transduction histidine kinase
VGWSASPLLGPEGVVQGVLASVRVAAPQPDWQELAGLAHDLRTPLQALRLLVPVLESMALPPEAREALEKVRASADRALSVGLDLLEWARGPTQGVRRLDRLWFALGPVLAELAAEQTPAAERKGIALVLDLGEVQGLEIHTDRVRLGRLLANLLSNAVRYTATGQVRFTASWRQEQGRATALSLAVVDTGSGISPEDQESIFESYQRGSSSGKEGDSGGSGVGLAVVDRLVQELGLTLEVFSEYGRGSRFELLLPMAILRQ